MFRVNNPASALSKDQNQNDDSNLDHDLANCRQQARMIHHDQLTRFHPHVKLPPRLQDKTIQEQIQRCCHRFKSYPAAVDTLMRALQTILRDEASPKHRRIDQTNPGYQRSLASAPGAEQLLLTVGFVPVGPQTLFLRHVNRDLLEMALDTLQLTTTTPEYQAAKKELVFARDVAALLAATPTPEELAKRQLLLSQVPKEPSQGRGALIWIQFPGGHHVSRRFDGDDTLQNVLDWLGGTVGTVFLEKLVETRQWSLVDVNRLGQTPVNCDVTRARHATLQHLGFWPSGRLQLRPSSKEWMERTTSSKMEMGESRGLASAPSETL